MNANAKANQARMEAKLNDNQKTWHEAMEAYCKTGNIFPLPNPRVKC
jgi:hypothetical protein